MCNLRLIYLDCRELSWGKKVKRRKLKSWAKRTKYINEHMGGYVCKVSKVYDGHTSAMLPKYQPSIACRAAAVGLSYDCCTRFIFQRPSKPAMDLQTQEALWKDLLMWMFSVFFKRKRKKYMEEKKAKAENLEHKPWGKWTICKLLS